MIIVPKSLGGKSWQKHCRSHSIKICLDARRPVSTRLQTLGLDFPLAIYCWPSANCKCGLVRADEWNKAWLKAGARMSFHAEYQLISTIQKLTCQFSSKLKMSCKGIRVNYFFFWGGEHKVFTFKRKLGWLLWLAFWLSTYESNQGAPHPPRSCAEIKLNCSGWCQLLVYDWRRSHGHARKLMCKLKNKKSE